VVTLAGTGHTLKERLDEAVAAASDWLSSIGTPGVRPPRFPPKPRQ
jgi:hypothetical protein